MLLLIQSHDLGVLILVCPIFHLYFFAFSATLSFHREALVQLLFSLFVKDVRVEQLQDQEEVLLSVLWVSCWRQGGCAGSPGGPWLLLPLSQFGAAIAVPLDCVWKPRKAPSPPLSGLTLPNMVRYVCKSWVVLLGYEGKLTTKRNKIDELVASW